MAYLKGVAAFVGPGCTLALDPVARLAGYWNIPILTGKRKTITKQSTLCLPLSFLIIALPCQYRAYLYYGVLTAQWVDLSIIINTSSTYYLYFVILITIIIIKSYSTDLMIKLQSRS